MEEPLTPEQAQAAFEAMAARGAEIAFRWLREGCECRAQLMIEHLQALGLHPGRAWALSVGRHLRAPHPDNPKDQYAWRNHIAPTLPVARVEYGVLVIDPSLSRTGPFTLTAWAAAMNARSIEVSQVGLSQAEILNRHAARALRGQELDAMLFVLSLGEPPIPELGGSGYRIGPDPPEGVRAHAHDRMVDFLDDQAKTYPRPP
jgi:hypothetical protein